MNISDALNLPFFARYDKHLGTWEIVNSDGSHLFDIDPKDFDTDSDAHSFVLWVQDKLNE